ncbi:MAG: FeoC-like transcriptional regulator [Anaerolineae bacterium]
MLRQILDLFEAYEGRTLSKEAIRSHLDVSPAMLDQMLLTLVQRGRLIEVGGCAGCTTCPLEHFCATSPTVSMTGYALAVGEETAV